MVTVCLQDSIRRKVTLFLFRNWSLVAVSKFGINVAQVPLQLEVP